MKRILLSILVLGLLSSCEKDNDVAPKQPVELDYSFLVAGHVYGDPGEFTLGFYPPFEEHSHLGCSSSRCIPSLLVHVCIPWSA